MNLKTWIIAALTVQDFVKDIIVFYIGIKFPSYIAVTQAVTVVKGNWEQIQGRNCRTQRLKRVFRLGEELVNGQKNFGNQGTRFGLRGCQTELGAFVRYREIILSIYPGANQWPRLPHWLGLFALRALMFCWDESHVMNGGSKGDVHKEVTHRKKRNISSIWDVDWGLGAFWGYIRPLKIWRVWGCGMKSQCLCLLHRELNTYL